MPDYIGSSSSSSRAISNMTGISFQHSKQPSVSAPIDDEQYGQVIEAFRSPSKEFSSGTCVPTNTPVSDLLEASKSSVASEPRVASHTRRASRPKHLKELSKPEIRESSDLSIRADVCAEDSTTENCSLPVQLISPSLCVKGKKEGQARVGAKEYGDVSNGNSPIRGSGKKSNKRLASRTRKGLFVSSESKRKRSSGSVVSNSQQPANDDIGIPSPTKASRPEGLERQSSESLEESLDTETPLEGQLE